MADYGIDVSGYNTINDWSAVRTMNSWAWSKATQAGGYTNPQFASQMQTGRSAGVAMGAYHFPDPRVSVASNVRHFVSVATPAGAFDRGAFLPMLDMENSPGDGITWSAAGANGFILAFRDALRNAAGTAQLCVYAPESWFAGGFLQPAQWADSAVVLCAAQYTGQPGQLDWSHARLAIHQYTDAAPTPGASGLTDRSVILAPYSLAQLTIGGAVSPAVTTNTEKDSMGDWFRFVDPTTKQVNTGVLLANSDFLGKPLPIPTPPVSDVDKDGWDDLVGRFAKNAALTTPQISVVVNNSAGQPVAGETTATTPQNGHYVLTFTPDAPAAG